MMKPLFSIVIANYNYGRFLEDAIVSVIEQDMGDKAELIICDAGSTDNSIDIIKKYSNRITWWCSEKDGGQSAAFNKGFAHAKGRFLTWLNADDILVKGALKAIEREIIRNPRCEWFVGSSVWCNESLKVVKCFCAHKFSFLRARWGTLSVSGPSSFFTSRLLNEVGGVDESLHYVMDTDLWYKFYNKCNAKYCRTISNVWAFRQHEASKMSGADNYNTTYALENRRKAIKESKILKERYGLHSGLSRKIACIISLSLVDYIISVFRNLKWRGCYAREI